MNATVYIDGKPVQPEADAEQAPRRGFRVLLPSERNVRVSIFCGHAIVVENGAVRRLSAAQAAAVIELVDGMGAA
jgi:hypothetical protein